MTAPKKVSREAFEKFDGERWNAMNDLLSLSGLEDLNPVQRKAYLAYWYMSEVYNGGHWQYFCNQTNLNHQETIMALAEIGAKEQSEILKQAIQRLPSEFKSPETVEQFINGYEEVDMSDLDFAFGECKKPVEDHLEGFLDIYEKDFIEWIP